MEDYREIEPRPIITAQPASAPVPVVVAPAPVPVVVAPVTVVAPGDDATTVDTGGGATVGRNVNARDFAGRDDVQYGSSGSSVTFNNPDNARIWVALMNQMQSLSDVAIKLDDLPNIVNRLITKVEVLEKLQVAVKVETVPIPVVVPLQSIYNLVIAFVIALSVVALAYWAGGRVFR